MGDFFMPQYLYYFNKHMTVYGGIDFAVQAILKHDFACFCTSL